MKNLIHVSLIALAFLTGCSTTKRSSNEDQQLHNKLLGTWEGETIRKDGNKKEWIQVRFPDGRYEIEFKYYDGAFVADITKESGKWWVEGGRFHEEMNYLGSTPFVYELEWLDENCIKMKSIKRDPNGDEYEGYTFSECRKMM